MLTPEFQRELILANGGHLSAASGLVLIGRRACVVADDEHELGMFDIADGSPVRLLRLFEGELPADPALRKALKPDLEALAVLPAFAGHPHGALLALGSGSKPRRHAGVLVALDAQGDCDGRVRQVDLTGWYEPLHALFDQLNIEGAFVLGDRLCLLQRGNNSDPRNACVSFDLHAVLLWLAEPALAVPAPLQTQGFALGTVEGVPLCFTDGAALPDGGWVFSAVAENTADAYLDGACLGAALGRVGPDGALRWIEPLSSPWKVEGVAVEGDEAGERPLRLALVTDADDPSVPARLLALSLPG